MYWDSGLRQGPFYLRLPLEILFESCRLQLRLQIIVVAIISVRSQRIFPKKLNDLGALDEKFEQQLADLGQHSKLSNQSPSRKPYSWKKGLLAFALLIVSFIVPFVVLVRTSVFVYLSYGFHSWLALKAGIGLRFCSCWDMGWLSA